MVVASGLPHSMNNYIHFFTNKLLQLFQLQSQIMFFLSVNTQIENKRNYSANLSHKNHTLKENTNKAHTYNLYKFYNFCICVYAPLMAEPSLAERKRMS